MSFEDGMKGYTFGMISLICIGVNIILGLIGLATIAWIAGLGSLVCAILAFVYGKRELALDPSNSKAKTGKTIGLVLIIINIVLTILGIVILLIGVSLFATMM